MTKYVLNSGGIRIGSKLAREFFAEVIKGLGKQPRILICCFAQPREDWQEKFENDKANTDVFPEDVNPVFELAFPDRFEEQIKNSDVVYIHGGDDTLLQYWLKKFDVPKIWDGKVVVGSSAGSDALSKHFWPCDWRFSMDGLGILPIKFIPHHQSSYGNEDTRGPIDWEAAKKELEEYGDKTLPIHALKEGEYIVFEV